MYNMFHIMNMIPKFGICGQFLFFFYNGRRVPTNSWTVVKGGGFHVSTVFVVGVPAVV
jgi:hypothetical protein